MYKIETCKIWILSLLPLYFPLFPDLLITPPIITHILQQFPFPIYSFPPGPLPLVPSPYGIPLSLVPIPFCGSGSLSSSSMSNSDSRSSYSTFSSSSLKSGANADQFSTYGNGIVGLLVHFSSVGLM